jgi:hypothetical protein
MTPGKKANEKGLKISDVARQTDTSLQTLSNWNKHKPKLFNVVLEGCKATKGAQDE